MIIAYLIGDCPEFFDSYAGTQVRLACVCLRHEDFTNYFKAAASTKDDARKAGEKVAEFFNAILQTLKVEASPRSP